MTRLSNDDFDADVIYEARARDAEWFEDGSQPNMAWLGTALKITSAAIVIAIAALVLC